MLRGQSVYFISDCGGLAKFLALYFRHRSNAATPPATLHGVVFDILASGGAVNALARSRPDAIVPLTGCFRANLNRVEPWITIHLESAVFMFHINRTTQGITGSLRAACSEPVQRFLACPFS
jgi:hypothetical protein